MKAAFAAALACAFACAVPAQSEELKLMTRPQGGVWVPLGGSLTKFNIYSPERWQKIEQRTSGENFGDLMRRIGI